jgi:hypothetical protein
MTKISASVIIADTWMSPYIIKFDGQSFHLYKVFDRKKEDNTFYTAEKLISSYKELADAADYICKMLVIERHSKRKTNKININVITLTEFINLYREIRNELFEKLKLN